MKRPVDAPSGVNSNKNGGNNNEVDDYEHKKKNTVTPWRRRRLQVCIALGTICFFVILGLTSRGYHRRHQNRVQKQQRRIWSKFRTDHDLGGVVPRQNKKNNNDSSEKKQGDKHPLPTYQKLDEYLEKHPKVAEEWKSHLQDNTEMGAIFEEDLHDDHDDWNPEGDFWDGAADTLGQAAENVGDWMHETAEQFLGKDLTHSLAGSVHSAVDSAGDFTDDVSRSFSKEIEEWGQALYDMLGATADTVSDWMGINGTDSNATSLSEIWADWTAGFFRPSGKLWNFTTEDEEADGDDEKAEDFNEKDKDLESMSEHRSYDKDSIAYKVGDFNPRPIPEGQSKKFAFVTTGFPTGDNIWRLETYVLGALKTWLKEHVLFYISNTRARTTIQEVCAKSPENEEACTRLYPIYVHCPPRDYGIATCCQQDKGMTRVHKFYPDFEWYVYHQDDLYFRIDYLANFVKKLPNPRHEAMLLSSSPFRAHGSIVPEPPFTKETWQEALSKMKSNCSSSPNHIYPWGNPALVYSNAALDQVVPGYRMLAISKQCAAFQVPAGAGSPIVHWMYQLPVVRMPMIASRTPKNLLAMLVPKSLAAPKEEGGDVAQKRREVLLHSGGLTLYHRFIAYRVEVSKLNFTELHNSFETAEKQIKELSPKSTLYPKGPYSYHSHRPNGYTETDLFKEQGYPQNWTAKWYTFKPEHCIQAELTEGENMLMSGSKWKGRKPERRIQNSGEIRKKQAEVLQKYDGEKREKVSAKLAERQKHREEALNKLDPKKKQELLSKLEALKKDHEAALDGHAQAASDSGEDLAGLLPQKKFKATANSGPSVAENRSPNLHVQSHHEDPMKTDLQTKKRLEVLQRRSAAAKARQAEKAANRNAAVTTRIGSGDEMDRFLVEGRVKRREAVFSKLSPEEQAEVSSK